MMWHMNIDVMAETFDPITVINNNNHQNNLWWDLPEAIFTMNSASQSSLSIAPCLFWSKRNVWESMMNKSKGTQLHTS
jgi:hypothetical protein